jgi:arabinogalactan endo-1,4-beta-galactosidase
MNTGTFTVDIEDDVLPVVAPDLSSGVVAESVQGRPVLTVVTNFAIANGHGVYYGDPTDVPTNRAAYYDIPTRSLTLVAEL